MSKINELYKKYEVEHYIIDTGDIELHQFYSPYYQLDDVLFTYNENNKTYEPVIYNYLYDKETGEEEGILIEQGDIIYEYVDAVKSVMKKTDVKNNRIIEGSFFIYQWVSSIHIITESEKYNSKVHELERSRQTGKSYELGFISAFMTVFGRLYLESENDKFWVVLASYRKKDGIDKVFEEAHSYLDDMIEHFNNKYPNKEIFTGQKTVNGESYYSIDKVSSQKTEISIIIDGEVRPYSTMIGLTTGTKNDGLSMDFGWLDEGQATSFVEFDRSVDPFRTSTGANLVVSGISSVDSANVQYYMHHADDTIKTCLVYPLAYNIMKITHPSRAEKMRKFVESKIKLNGLESTRMQTNYFLNWETLDGKFYTKKLLKQNKNYGEMFNELDQDASYRVAGLDLSSSSDYTTIIIVDVFKKIDKYYDKETDKYKNQVSYDYELRVIETYNKDRSKKLSAEEIAEKTAKLCDKYEVGMLLCDGTSMQIGHVEWIVKMIIKDNIDTLVNYYNFGGAKNKVYLMSHLESVLHSGRLKLGSRADLQHNWGWKKLYDEMLYMKRIEKKNKNNVQWEAPEGKEYTDDHVMALALSVYNVVYNLKLMRGSDKDKEITIGKFTRDVELNIFGKKKKKKKQEIMSYYYV